MDFPTSLKQIQILLQKELTVFFARKRKEAGKINTQLFPLVDQIADLTLRGGKRMRPFLCWMGYEAISNIKYQIAKIKNQKSKINLKNNKTILNIMLGMELFQAFALIHDDIIDEDEERRGKSTIHAYFSHDLRLPAGKAGLANNDLRNHFGTSMAILAGDLALVWADECMGNVKSLPAGEAGQSSNPPAGRAGVKTDLLMAYQKMKEQVVYGQTLDVLSQFQFAKIKKEEIDELKTAWYSVVWPLTLGALLAGVNQDRLNKLKTFGLAMGLAFQLRDDFLDQEISRDEFELKAIKYTAQADQAITEMSLSLELEKTFRDFALFVIERKL